jgi:hypothetical protein
LYLALPTRIVALALGVGDKIEHRVGLRLLRFALAPLGVLVRQRLDADHVAFPNSFGMI